VTDFTITSGFLDAVDWRQNVHDAGGFFDFTDGALQCVMLNGDALSAQVVRRTAVEPFENTVTNAFNGDNRRKLIINGCYQDNATSSGIWKKLSKSPSSPGDFEIMGDVVESGTQTTSHPNATRAFFAFDSTQRSQAPVCFFGIGHPPTAIDAALGGLGPVLITSGSPTTRKAFDNTDNWYASLNAFPARTGRVGIASSIAKGLVMVFGQPDQSTSGLTIDQLRDKLNDADFDDAVLLDGSDSVMLVRDGAFRIRQGAFKNRVTTIGLTLFYAGTTSVTTP
jgi:hypothetical protein